MRNSCLFTLLLVSLITLSCESTTESTSDIIETRTLTLKMGDTLEVVTNFHNAGDSLTGSEKTLFRIDSTNATIAGKSGVVRLEPSGYILTRFRYLDNGDVEYPADRPRWIPVASSGKGTRTATDTDTFSYPGVYDRHVYTTTSHGLGDTVITVDGKKYRAGLASLTRKSERVLNDVVSATEIEEGRVVFVFALGAGLTTLYFPTQGKASHHLTGVRRAVM